MNEVRVDKWLWAMPRVKTRTVLLRHARKGVFLLATLPLAVAHDKGPILLMSENRRLFGSFMAL